MIADLLEHAEKYYALGNGIKTALEYLQHTDLDALAPGKYAIDGDKIFVIVQEYETLDTANEQMESHRKYIDVQYMIRGAELVGHAMLQGQQPSKAYNEADDYMLYADAPSFFSKLSHGMFMVFFPADLHMPCIKDMEAAKVKKAVVKVCISKSELG